MFFCSRNLDQDYKIGLASSSNLHDWTLDNSNISGVNLYQTTGGGKRFKNFRGGSPASNRVMNLLATDCNLAKSEPLSPIENSDISRVNLYQTTGGRRKLNKRRANKLMLDYDDGEMVPGLYHSSSAFGLIDTITGGEWGIDGFISHNTNDRVPDFVYKMTKI